MASNYNRKSNTSGSRRSSAPRSRSARPTGSSSGRTSSTNTPRVNSSRTASSNRNRRSTPQNAPLSSVRIGDIDRTVRKHRVEKSYKRYVVRIAVVLTLIIALLVGGIVIYNSNLFTITQVNVKGVEHLTADEMTELAAVPTGTTLLRVDEAGIKSRLAEEAWVKEVNVNRVFPDTLELAITERTIAAVVEVPVEDSSENENWAIASDGMWLMHIPRQDSEEAQSISVKVYEDAQSVLKITSVPYGVIPEVGSYCSDDNVNNALAVVDGMTTDLSGRVTTVLATGVETTTLILDNGIEIAFGNADDIRSKERVCLELMEQYPDQITYINVRNVNSPTWRSVS